MHTGQYTGCIDIGRFIGKYGVNSGYTIVSSLGHCDVTGAMTEFENMEFINIGSYGAASMFSIHFSEGQCL